MQIRIRITLLVSLLLAIAVFVPLAMAADATGTISGIVVDAEKKGVEAIDISIYHVDQPKNIVATAVTSNDGKFTLKDVPAGKDYVVKAVKRKCFEPAGNGKSRSYGLESNPKRGEIHDCTTTMFHHRPEGYHP